MPKTSAYSTLKRFWSFRSYDDDLLAEQLGSESANPKDVCDGVRIPSLGEHRDGNDAADGAAELSRLAHGVHDLAKKLLIGDVLTGTGIPCPLDTLTAEALDLVNGTDRRWERLHPSRGCRRHRHAAAGRRRRRVKSRAPVASCNCDDNSEPDGSPFLETHHLIRLADGGPDTVENAVAVCPNCHRRLHYGRARTMEVAEISSRLLRKAS
jgi:hypothetical protein